MEVLWIRAICEQGHECKLSQAMVHHHQGVEGSFDISVKQRFIMSVRSAHQIMQCDTKVLDSIDGHLHFVLLCTQGLVTVKLEELVFDDVQTNTFIWKCGINSIWPSERIWGR